MKEQFRPAVRSIPPIADHQKVVRLPRVSPLFPARRRGGGVEFDLRES